jgi:hypothetical protein
MTRHFKHVCAAAVLALTATHALAVGRLADLTVIDRTNGITLPVYYHAGQYWVPGRPGAKYAISLCNKVGERLLAVTSVDGINVLSGTNAAWGQTGYVFGNRACYDITGWRKSDSEVAAFEFSASSDSYAALTGRPGEVGVIGVALFRERLPEPVIAPPVYRKHMESGRLNESRADSAPDPSAQEQNSAGSAKSTAGRSSSADNSLSASPSAPQTVPKLGTGHGQREESMVSRTEFERAQDRPNEIIKIRYDSREALVAMGVIPSVSQRVPNPFPMSGNSTYVPDPPIRRYQ